MSSLLTSGTTIENSKSGSMEQLILGTVLIIVLYISLLFVEIAFKYIKRLTRDRVELLPYTYVMDNKSISISQDPNKKESKTANLSENERTGIEFSYSFYLS